MQRARFQPRPLFSRLPEAISSPVYPLHFRALRNMRIHGESSPRFSGCQDICTVRNTRSGCGIMIVKRTVGRGHAGEAAGRTVRVGRIDLRRVAGIVEIAHRHRDLAEITGFREVGTALAMRDDHRHGCRPCRRGTATAIRESRPS